MSSLAHCTGLVVAGWLLSGCPSHELCDNQQDDDVNGYTDCDDIACVDEPVCQPTSEDCWDGADNDRDGKTDCQDEDCSLDAACIDGVGGEAAGAGGEFSSGTGGDSEVGTGGYGQVGGCVAPSSLTAAPDYQPLEALESFPDFTSGSCQTESGGFDAAFVFEAEDAGLLSVEVYATGANVDVSLRSSCADAGSELACSAEGTTGMADSVSLAVLAGQRIYVLVSGATDTALEPPWIKLTLD